MSDITSSDSQRALWLSTFAFTVCFAVWTIFSIIGIQIREQLSLSETQFGLLIGMPILTGSLVRIVLGFASDRWGGRLVYTATMLAAALATFLLSWATTYPQMLVAALGVGLAGGSFAVGVAYVSRFFDGSKQGTALGIFGVGNVGAAVTKFLAPFVMFAFGWQATAQIWAAALVLTAVLFWTFGKDDPVTLARRGATVPRRSLRAEFAPLENVQVWRFSAYYFFCFGAFVALVLWLPHYLIGVYGIDLKTAGMIAAAYSIPASIFRAYGGVLSDKIGARAVMYATFLVSLPATAILAFPTGVSLPIFLLVVFVLGFFMSLGKAAVFKHVASYFPHNVGVVGGLVGMIGGLGGFILPLLFGWLKEQTGLWSSCFVLLFVLVGACMLWMTLSIRQTTRTTLRST